jgi:hypothetical protein
MYPARILSLNNGWKLLTEQQIAEWEEIRTILAAINDDIIKGEDTSSLGQDSKEGTADVLVGGYFEENDASVIADKHAAFFMENIYVGAMQKVGWVDTIVNSEKEALKSGRSFIKNRTIISILATKYSSGSFNQIVYVDTYKNAALGLADVSVILVPDKDAFKSFDIGDDQVFAAFYEDECRNKIADIQYLENKNPVVFVFFSHDESKIAIEEIVFKKLPFVDRAIVFPPEYYQAGVTVLSHFGEILRQKYPNINAKVRIEQDDNIVRMHVELPNGEVDTIEEVLEKYLLVVRDKASPATIFDNKLQIIALENKLDLIKAELKSTERVLKFALEGKDEMKAAHKKAITEFQFLVGEQAEQINNQSEQISDQSKQIKALIQLSSQQNASHERIQIAQIGHVKGLFKDLLGEAQGNQVLLVALHSLEHNLMSGIATIDVQDQIKDSLSIIEDNSPNLLTRIAAQVEGAGYGVILPALLDLIKQHIQLQ